MGSGKIGRYQVVRRIAAGGMAEVFLAKLLGERGFEKNLVIKKLLPQWSSDVGFIEMLIDEAKILVGLNHPNIAQIFELGREGGAYFIAMEYVSGPDLRSVLSRMPPGETLPTAVSLSIVRDVLAGLSYAHEKGIIHRDISPHNILLSDSGIAKVIDFGIAKAVSRGETTSQTLKGKFAYMSPEQASGGVVEPRSDLFSAGIILYELLTGERLYGGGTDVEVLDRARRGELLFSKVGRARVPEGLQSCLQTVLAKTPEERFSSAEEFAGVLERWAQAERIVLGPRPVSDYIRETASVSAVKADSIVETKTGGPGAGRKRGDALWIRWGALPGGVAAAGAAIWIALSPVGEPLMSVSSDPEVGYLDIQASPWGFVRIDGRAKGETPLKGHPLQIGRHQVTVYYKPKNRTLSSQIQVAAGRTVACLANFSTGGGMTCR